LISAKNRVDLSSISEVRSYITEWPRFFGPPCMFNAENFMRSLSMSISIAFGANRSQNVSRSPKSPKNS